MIRRVMVMAKWLLVAASVFLFVAAPSGPNNRICVNKACSDEFAITCAGTPPNCVGGCWFTGSYPCDVCYEMPNADCQLRAVDLNVGLWRSDCGGPRCGTCIGNWRLFGDFHVTTSDC